MRSCENCGWLEVNPSGAMFCGYSEERTWKDECCTAWKDKDESKTNADRIRAMSDSELSQFLTRLRHNWFCLPGEDTAPACAAPTCYDCWQKWLQKEAEP